MAHTVTMEISNDPAATCGCSYRTSENVPFATSAAAAISADLDASAMAGVFDFLSKSYSKTTCKSYTISMWRDQKKIDFKESRLHKSSDTTQDMHGSLVVCRRCRDGTCHKAWCKICRIQSSVVTQPPARSCATSLPMVVLPRQHRCLDEYGDKSVLDFFTCSFMPKNSCVACCL